MGADKERDNSVGFLNFVLYVLGYFLLAGIKEKIEIGAWSDNYRQNCDVFTPCHNVNASVL